MLKRLLKRFGYRLVKASEEPREIVRAFADEMELELSKNDHKGGWRKASRDYLLVKLDSHVYSLKYALWDEEPPHNVRKYAADVANFAMMLADNFGELATESTQR